MPEKHPNTLRWGGPGASHENRDKPPPEKGADPRAGGPTNPPVSQVSGGGGERDLRHGHQDQTRSSKPSKDGVDSPRGHDREEQSFSRRGQGRREL